MARYPHPAADGSPAEQAAEWLVLLSVDDPSARAYYQQAFIHWQAADPAHAAATARMQGFIRQLQDLRPQPILQRTLQRTLATRPARRGAWTALAVLPVLLWGVWQSDAAQGWRADYHSRHDGNQHIRLADGSQLQLQGETALDVDFDARQRRLTLRGGALLVSVGKDPSRPFIVQTRHGEMMALGTRFIVRDGGAGTVLQMLESRVSMRTPSRPPQLAIAGQQWLLGAQGIQPLGEISSTEQQQAWQHGRLVVNDMPLPLVLDVLTSHLPGWVLQDRAGLSAIRVSVVLPLDQPEAALSLLLQSLPQLVHYRVGSVRYLKKRG